MSGEYKELDLEKKVDIEELIKVELAILENEIMRLKVKSEEANMRISDLGMLHDYIKLTLMLRSALEDQDDGKDPLKDFTTEQLATQALNIINRSNRNPLQSFAPTESEKADLNSKPIIIEGDTI